MSSAYNGKRAAQIEQWAHDGSYYLANGVLHATRTSAPVIGGKGKGEGYLYITKQWYTDGKRRRLHVPVHQLVFRLKYGRPPKHGRVIDHIDRDRTNNAASNLREACHQLNAQNRTLTNRIDDHYLVSYCKRDNCYRFSTTRNGQPVYGPVRTSRQAAVADRDTYLASL